MTTPSPSWYRDQSGAVQQNVGPVTDPPVPPPAYRVHSPAGVAWACALGTPVAGGIVLALNYWKWGQKGLAAAAIAAGLLTTGILFWLVWVLPDTVPSAVYVTAQVICGLLAARALQSRRVDAHVVSGGNKASNWVGAGIGLAVCTPLMAAFVAAVLFSGINPSAIVDMEHSVDMGHDQHVYYSRGASQDDAEHFGEALQAEGYFDGTVPGDVLIFGAAGHREISFFADESQWRTDDFVEAVRAMTERIAPDIGGKPMTVRILDENSNELGRFTIE